ncbi:MAG: hypothetical protein GXO83_07725 [Chlorobi bacterium]|nr:hypothetical protein [Chlorobiota bacterium]
MRRISAFFLSVLMAGSMVYAGGIVTNTNQSAAWARYFSRYATTDVDAVFFNPAGLAKLSNGLHFSINNQSIWQTQTLSNDFPMLNYGPDYVGKVQAPVFPSIYGAFKLGKIVISAGFNPIGGGGGATYDKGVPSFEFLSGVNLANELNTLLNDPTATTAYSVNTFLKGTSVYYGAQAGLTYKINDMISVFAGARYVSAVNHYSGYLKDLQINTTQAFLNPTGAMMPATDFFQGGADLANTAYTGLDDAINAGLINSTDPLSDAVLIGALDALGLYQSGMTNGQAVLTFMGLESQFLASVNLVSDQEVDVKQTGSGITPIVGIHVSLPMIDVALKYEMKTALQLTNATTKDFLMGYDSTGAPVTMYPDGGVTNADMPAMLSGGVNVHPVKKLMVSAGFEYYWDKNVNWDGREKLIESNSYNINISAQFNLTKKLLVSGAYGYANMGVGKNYQTDLSYSLSSSSIGFGGAYDITSFLRLNVGYTMVMYANDVVEIPGLYTQTYGKDTKLVAVGLDFNF